MAGSGECSAGKPHDRVYKIGGIGVEFPYRPYASQLAFMGKVVATLERSHRQQQQQHPGQDPHHCHALLESPTGTGKSLALLCSTLAWQKHFKAANATATAASSSCGTSVVTEHSPHPIGSEDFTSGGGFIAETPDAAARSQCSKSVSKRQKAPTIYYATRTHSQITQVLREYRKTSYRVSMAVLAARKHYCSNKHVCKKKNIDEECKLLLKDPNRSCLQFKNVHKVKNHSSLRKGGAHEVHDIEDLVNIGNSVKGCAYFAARSMALDAELVFCPYSYLLNPVIRSAMEINLQGAIIILDEAHNIEDAAREAGSIDLEMSTLEAMRTELQQLSAISVSAEFYCPLLDMVQDMLSWVYQKAQVLEKQDFEHYSSCWSGERVVQELESAGISFQNFPILSECAKKAVTAASEAESNTGNLSGFSAGVIEGLFTVLSYMLKDNGKHLCDYRLVVQKFVKRDEEVGVTGWACQLSLWCLNPAVIFNEVAAKAQSIILTSGTLSPIGSFASELGVPFDVCMEAPHVVDMKTQVWAASIAKGPGNVPLNASYKHADGYAFQDALGTALEEVFKVSPDGALVFFPSYKLLEKLCDRWKSTGQWDRLSQLKKLFIEPRGKMETFEKMLDDYYTAINGKPKNMDQNSKSKLFRSRKRSAKEQHINTCLSQQSKGGAAFLAVCRGKVSEGLDFSDKNARLVIVVGIPFPNQKDLQVNMKKQYNSQYMSSKNLLSGDQWYCYQAFRALNQAVGRCIRHRQDYGAILLLDERYKRAGNLEYMSKWLRNSIQQVESFGLSLKGLQSFFGRFEVSHMEGNSQRHVEDMCFSGSAHLDSLMKPRPVKCLQSARGVGCDESQPFRDCTNNKPGNDKEKTTDLCPVGAVFNSENSNCPARAPHSSAQEQSPETRYRPTTSTFSKSPKRTMPWVISRTLYAGDVESSCSRNSYGFTEKIAEVTSETLTLTKASMLETPPGQSSHLDSQFGHSAVTGFGTCEGKCATADFCKPFEKVEQITVQCTASKSSLEMASHLDLPVRRLSSDFVACVESVGKIDHNKFNGSSLEESASKALSIEDELSSEGRLSINAQNKNLEPDVLCSSCGKSLLKAGLQKSDFSRQKLRVKKIYLLDVFNSLNASLPVSYLDVMVYRMSLLHPSIGEPKNSAESGNHCSESSQGVWVENDGCVFKTLFCPWCYHCIGVHVVAANLGNMELVNKALLFYEATVSCQETPKISTEETNNGSQIDFKTRGTSSRQAIETPARPKLKLPRHD